jgi:sugar lactone lactonase YvrE
VLWNTRLSGGGIIRALAAQDTRGPDGEIITAVWVGGWDGVVWKLDGESGGILLQTASPTRNYGFALDGSGNLWISGRSDRVLGRIDTHRCVDTRSCDVAPCGADGDTCIKQAIPIPSGHNPYGITVDSEQRVWLAMLGTRTIARYDPRAGGSRWTFQNVGVDCHGIAADAAGWVWAAGYDAGVVRLDAANPSRYWVVAGTGGRGSKGMAVDFDGNIWSINQSGQDATVIEPGPTLMEATVFTRVVPQLVAPYTYSDMTGQQLRLATDPHGWYRRPFEGCPESVTETEWRELRFEGDTPPGTLMRFRVRTAETRAGLASAMWVLVGEAPPARSPLQIGDALRRAGVEPQRWLEVEVQLEAMRSSTSEVITPRLSALAVTRACNGAIF